MNVTDERGNGGKIDSIDSVLVKRGNLWQRFISIDEPEDLDVPDRIHDESLAIGGCKSFIFRRGENKTKGCETYYRIVRCLLSPIGCEFASEFEVSATLLHGVTKMKKLCT